MIPGIQFSGIPSGIKAAGPDLGLVFFTEPVNVLTLYTRNRVKAAHILYDRKIDAHPVRALLVNSGCANACTGPAGVADLRKIATNLAPSLGILSEEILFASTGVIGRRLPTDRIIAALPELGKNLGESHLEDFTHAIMTTDTFPKIATRSFRGRKEYQLAGVAKGAGMINPLFATMLSFIFTDYPLSIETGREPFMEAGKQSFERITVDGECSTNDTVMLFSSRNGEDPSAFEAFQEALLEVMRELSLMIVKDGEGATRIIHITVNGARRKEHAERIARRIATSPLTKTAFFGCDPNWGRIIAAAGDAGVPVTQSKVEIIVQGKVLARGGMEQPFDEEEMKKRMDSKEIELFVNLNSGPASYDIYTTDLTYDYIKINASYRT
jgi:glutamate N-acetyltransferase / amino-acid N-acetyltransferase